MRQALLRRAKRTIKRRLFPRGSQPLRVRFGVAKGVVLYFDRQRDLQREWGLYETESQAIYRKMVRRTDTVYDIGGADGLSALGFARLARQGAVISFEADATVCARFRRNLTLNPALSSRVRLVPAFVSDERRDDPGALTINIDDAVREGSLPPPNFVKIDVDGAEMQVLRGMDQTLRTYRPPLLIETHSLVLEQDCQSFLDARGFHTKIIDHAWWRRLYPEHRPTAHNRWLLACP